MQMNSSSFRALRQALSVAFHTESSKYPAATPGDQPKRPVFVDLLAQRVEHDPRIESVEALRDVALDKSAGRRISAVWSSLIR